jgi:hypothetical protein
VLLLLLLPPLLPPLLSHVQPSLHPQPPGALLPLPLPQSQQQQQQPLLPQCRLQLLLQAPRQPLLLLLLLLHL